jgi:hypothetical protein
VRHYTEQPERAVLHRGEFIQEAVSAANATDATDAEMSEWIAPLVSTHALRGSPSSGRCAGPPG